MKRLLFATLILLSLNSCTNDDQPNCDCNRVTEVNIGYNDPAWYYVTKNECSGEIKQFVCDPNNHPNVGDCK